MLSTTEVLLLHSIASAVSGVTESTPSGAGGLLAAAGPPAVSASRSLACELLELLEDMAQAAATPPGAQSCCCC